MNSISKKLSTIDTKAAKEVLIFFVKTISVYIAWKAFTYSMEHIPMLTPYWESLQVFCGETLAKITAFFVCDIFGYKGYSFGRNFAIEGTNGIAIKNSCIGISAMAIFGGLIAAYPGKWKHKLWYIPLGIILVQASNVFRLVGLAIMKKHSDEAFVQFNHGYTYVIITYSFIFILVVHWINKWANKP